MAKRAYRRISPLCTYYTLGEESLVQDIHQRKGKGRGKKRVYEYELPNLVCLFICLLACSLFMHVYNKGFQARPNTTTIKLFLHNFFLLLLLLLRDTTTISSTAFFLLLSLLLPLRIPLRDSRSPFRR